MNRSRLWVIIASSLAIVACESDVKSQVISEYSEFPAYADQLSKAEFVDQVTVDIVRVPMRDGVEIALQIHRPDADGQFPVVLGYNPYRRVFPVRPDYRDYEPRYVSYLAERGYAVVHFDVRGTGNSDGTSVDIYSDEERHDAYEIVEWLARQPWSNGNVGMKGISYGGVVQWQTAVQQPPSLKAIIVRSANDSVYTEWTYPGGALRPYMFDTFSPLMTAFNFSPPDPEVVGERWEEMWLDRLENNRPWGIGFIRNQQENDYWLDRSLSKDYSRVQAATMVIGGWSDVYPTALLRAYRNIDAPKKAIVGPWMHVYSEEERALPGPRIDGRPIYLRFLDHWLKGIDNGVMDEPPVLLFVREFDPPSAVMPLEEPGFWRHELDWPISRRVETAYYLHPDGRLSEFPYEGPASSGMRLAYNPTVGLTSGIHWGGGILPWGNPIDQRLDDPYSLVFTSDELDLEVEVTGEPEVVLAFEAGADRAYFRAKLIDVAPDGTAKLVNTQFGGMNATHRYSHSDPVALEVGKKYEVRVPLKALSYVFQKGHRIRLAVSTADIKNAWPIARTGEDTVLSSSFALLPVIPKEPTPLGTPDLVRLATADPELAWERQRPSRYSIEHDLLADSVIIHLGRTGAMSRERAPGNYQHTAVGSRYEVSNRNPGHAQLNATFTNSLDREGERIDVVATEALRSDDDSFYYDVHVEVFRNSVSFFEREWREVVERVLN